MDENTSSAEDYSSISTLMSFQDPNSTLLQTPENSQFSYVELSNTSSSNPFDSQFLLPTSSGSLQVIVPSYVTEVNSAEDQTVLHGRSYVDIPLIDYGTRNRCNSNGRTPKSSTETTLLSSSGLQSEPLHFQSLVLPTSLENTNSLLSSGGLHLVSSSSSQNTPISNNTTASETTNRSVINVIKPISEQLPSAISTAAKAEFLHPSLGNTILTHQSSTSSVGPIDLNCTEILGHQQLSQQSAIDLFQQVSTEQYLQCKSSILEKKDNSDQFSLHTNGSSWNAAASSAGTKTNKLRDGVDHQPKTSCHGSTSVVSGTSSKPSQISILNSNSSHSKFSFCDSGSSQAIQNLSYENHNQPSFIVVPPTSDNQFCEASFVPSTDNSVPDTVTKIFSNGCKFFNKDVVTSQDTRQNILCQMLELPDVMSPFPRTPLAEDLFSNFNSKKHSDDTPQMQTLEETSQFTNQNTATCSYAKTISESDALGSIGASSFHISNLAVIPNISSSCDIDKNSGVDHHTETICHIPTNNNGADNTIKIQLPSQYIHQNVFAISNSNIELATAEQISQSRAVQTCKVSRSTALIPTHNVINKNTIERNKENLCGGSYPALSSTSLTTAPEEIFPVGKPLPLGQCLYEMVSMLKCSTCSRLFQDAAAFVAHYRKVHCTENQISPVKITVRTSNATMENEKPIVVCQQCGTAVPPAVLDWYTTRVRGKPSGRKRKSVALPQASRSTKQNESLSVSSSGSCSNKDSDGESSSLDEEESDNDTPAQHRDSDDGMQIYVLGGVAAAKQAKSPVGEISSLPSSPPRKRRSLRPPARLQLYDLPSRPPLATPPAPKKIRCRKPGCTLRLTTEENRDLHEQCHLPPNEDPRKGFACPFCHLPCPQWHLTQRHLWRVHKKDVGMLVCGICHTYKAHNAYTLRVHQETHTTDRKYPCKECGLQFRQLSQLLGHSKTHSTATVLPAQCTVCHRVFANARLLSKHVKTVHENIRPHACPHCEYRSDRSTDLKTHLRKHTKETPLCCPVCNRRFSNQSSYRRHLLRHLPQPLLHCPRCTFATSLPFHFAQHCSTQHEQGWQDGHSFNCKVCGTNWNSVPEYTGHSRTHHSDMIAQLLVQHPDPEEQGPDC